MIANRALKPRYMGDFKQIYALRKINEAVSKS